MTGRPSEAGFSLVETLVSLAIIAAMTGLLFDAISTNARAAHHLAQKRAAILLARSLLAQAVVPPGPGELAETGRAQGMSWRLVRRSMGGGARDEGVPLEEVHIEVLDPSTGRPLTSVQTLRMAR